MLDHLVKKYNQPTGWVIVLIKNVFQLFFLKDAHNLQKGLREWDTKPPQKRHDRGKKIDGRREGRNFLKRKRRLI